MSMKAVRYGLWGAVAMAAGVVGGLAYTGNLNGTNNLGQTVTKVVGTAKIGGSFNLIDHNGAQITDAALKGNPSVIFFGFTHCPEICPTTLAEMDAWLEKTGDVGKDIKAYFVTVDPERDNPEVMKDYVTAFSERITGVTGDVDKVNALTKSYRIYSKKVKLPDGDYTMDHTASVILLDKNGEFVSTIAYGEQEETAVKKLQLLAKRG